MKWIRFDLQIHATLKIYFSTIKIIKNFVVLYVFRQLIDKSDAFRRPQKSSNIFWHKTRFFCCSCNISSVIGVVSIRRSIFRSEYCLNYYNIFFLGPIIIRPHLTKGSIFCVNFRSFTEFIFIFQWNYFSRVRRKKSVYRSRHTDERLHLISTIGTTKLEPDLSLLVNKITRSNFIIKISEKHFFLVLLSLLL